VGRYVAQRGRDPRTTEAEALARDMGYDGVTVQS
jgi:hypothetical protein